MIEIHFKNKKGIMLIACYLVIVVLSILGSAFLIRSVGESKTAERERASVQAFYLAEAGIDRAFWYLTRTPADAPDTAPDGSADGSWRTTAYPAAPGLNPTDPQQEPLGNGNYTIWVESSGSNIKIYARGTTVTGQEATVEAVFGTFPPIYANALGSGGDVDLSGASSFWIFESWVIVNGPVSANDDILLGDRVQINGTQTEDAGLYIPQFLETAMIDTDGDGIPDTESWIDFDGISPPNPNANDSTCNHFYDVNGDGDPVNALAGDDFKGPYNSRRDNNDDGAINLADNPFIDDPADPADNYDLWNTEFGLDDIDGNGEINDRDGFINFYKAITPDQNEYVGDQSFGPFDTSIPSGTEIVFVDGDVDILLNAQWWGAGAQDLTVVATGDINIAMPVNGPDDRINLFAFENVSTVGLGWGESVNATIYAHDAFYAYWGGEINGSIVADDIIYGHTESGFAGDRVINYDNRIETDSPLGLPPVGGPGVLRLKSWRQL